MIDLSANENPYKISDRIMKEMKSCLEESNRYLEQRELDELLVGIADYCQMKKERLMIAHGTDLLIKSVFLKFYKNRDLLVFNPNSYQVLELAKDLGVKIKRIQLKPSDLNVNWTNLNFKDSFIIIDYPNNPTGKFLIKRDELIHLLNQNNLVIIDEAAFEYSKETFIDLVEHYENLVITRTFDKAFGLAGFKVSYMIMGDAILNKLTQRVMINKPACKAALVMLSHKDKVDDFVKQTLLERSFLESSLLKLNFDVYKSAANFLLVKTNQIDFASKLSKMGILIEDLSKFWLNGYYRISVGTRAENTQLIEAVKIINMNN